MNKEKVKIQVIKEKTGYSATVAFGSDFIATEAENFEELKEEVLAALNFAMVEKKKE